MSSYQRPARWTVIINCWTKELTKNTLATKLRLYWNVSSLQIAFALQRWPPNDMGGHPGDQSSIYIPAPPPWTSGSNIRVQHRKGQPPQANQWHLAGSQLCVSWGGSVEALGWLLEARTSKVEFHWAQIRVRAEKSQLRGDEPLEAHLAAHLCATQSMSGCWPLLGGRTPEVLWKVTGAMLVKIIRWYYFRKTSVTLVAGRGLPVIQKAPTYLVQLFQRLKTVGIKHMIHSITHTLSLYPILLQLCGVLLDKQIPMSYKAVWGGSILN